MSSGIKEFPCFCSGLQDEACSDKWYSTYDWDMQFSIRLGRSNVNQKRLGMRLAVTITVSIAIDEVRENPEYLTDRDFRPSGATFPSFLRLFRQTCSMILSLVSKWLRRIFKRHQNLQTFYAWCAVSPVYSHAIWSRVLFKISSRWNGFEKNYLGSSGLLKIPSTIST